MDHIINNIFSVRIRRIVCCSCHWPLTYESKVVIISFKPAVFLEGTKKYHEVAKIEEDYKLTMACMRY